MVTTRLTVVEHAKQLVSHGAHAADIEVVEGLLAELEKSKKAFENLQQFTRRQFNFVRVSELLRNLQSSPNMIADVTNEVRKLQETAHEFEVFRTQWNGDNPGLVDPTEEGFKFEYLQSFNQPPFEVPGKEGTFDVVGGRDPFGRILVYTLPKLPKPQCSPRPHMEQYDEVVHSLQKSSQESNL